MKISYVWAKPAPKKFEFKGRIRPPDELYVEEALKEIGVEVHRTHYHTTLAMEIAQAKPDMVLFSHPPQGYGGALVASLRASLPEAVLGLLSFDLTFHESDENREKRYRDILPHLDFFAAKEEGRTAHWAEQGVSFVRAIQGHHPYVSKVWEPPAESPDPRPALFIGSYSRERDEILAKLQKKLGDGLKVVSQTGGWQETSGIHGPVFGHDRQELFNQVSCVVDINNGATVQGHFSDRILDVMAAGVPLITQLHPEDHDFLEGAHLVSWGTDTPTLAWWVDKIRKDSKLASRLSEMGHQIVTDAFTYKNTAEDVLRAYEMVLERKSRIPTEILQGDHNPEVVPEVQENRTWLVLGQWRPQGLGYIARRIVQVGETLGKTVKVATINRNPEWDEEHRHDVTKPPPEGTEVIFFLEKANDGWLDWAKSNDAKTVYMPMQEFFRDEPEARWAREMDVVAAIPNEAFAGTLEMPVMQIRWDSGLRPWRPFFPPYPVFYHDARGLEQGKYNVRPRHHTDVVLGAWREAHAKLKKLGTTAGLMVRCKNDGLPSDEKAGIVSYTADYPYRHQMFWAIYGATAAICPTAPEGFGLPYYEYQALGLPPIALDVAPANQAIRHDMNGWLIPAKKGKPSSLTYKWIPDEEALVKAILHAVKPQVAYRAKMGCYNQTRLRQDEFFWFLKGLLYPEQELV